MIVRRFILITFSVCTVVPLAIGVYSASQVLAGFSGTFDADDHAECGIIFGAAVHGSELPGPGILRRVSAGADLYNNDRIDRLILTGGKGSGEQQSEAQVMRDVAVTKGIPDQFITLEEQSTSTWENIAYSAPLLSDCEGIVGVSDRYHLARIQLIARKQGMMLDTYPADAASSKLFEWRSVAREIAGYLVYLFGYEGS